MGERTKEIQRRALALLDIVTNLIEVVTIKSVQGSSKLQDPPKLRLLQGGKDAEELPHLIGLGDESD